MQTPHFNLALLELVQAFKNSECQSACQRGIAEIDNALRLGPEYADLHYTKARLYARAATQDATMKKHALDNLEKAIALGFPLHQLDRVGFTELSEDPRFKKLIQSVPPQTPAALTPRLLDPVPD